MATITVTTRKTASGKRYDVRYRLGGRAYPVVRAGTFKTEREAKARRDLVAGEIAHGRNPADLLAQVSNGAGKVVSLDAWGERFVASRIDVAGNTRKMYRSHLRKLGQTFGDRDPHSITAANIAEWVAEQAEERKPGTVAQYLDVFKVLLDYIGIEPNPARDPRVKLPRRVTEEANPPSDEHFLAMIETLLPRWRLFDITIEQGGLRIGEAVALRWGDGDVAGGRLRLPRTATKTNTSRWVQLPGWLMEAIEDTCPVEDASMTGVCSKGFSTQLHGRHCPAHADSPKSRTTRRMIFGIAGSHFGISQACRRASLRNVLGTPSRR